MYIHANRHITLSPGELPLTCPCTAAIADAVFPSQHSCTGSQPAPEPHLLKAQDNKAHCASHPPGPVPCRTAILNLVFVHPPAATFLQGEDHDWALRHAISLESRKPQEEGCCYCCSSSALSNTNRQAQVSWQAWRACWHIFITTVMPK